MFTTQDVKSTKKWISEVVERDIPVGSLNALATWEDALMALPERREEPTLYAFYQRFLSDSEFRGKIHDQIRAKLQ